MKFNTEKGKSERVGEIVGYVLMYLIFTTILYFILKLLNLILKTF